ncbi:MAG: thioredoxin domain-containing protein [Acidobacteriota bacterium]
MQSHPGSTPYPAELRAKLLDALSSRGEAYEPRTHHFDAAGGPTYTNRLILEDSPYLLQHAHNPVDWYPWGPEAFEQAKATDKPIFLSIGYSTCHWCHVMERESFEDLGIAKLMNELFVCIKIDRERRPDIDDFYMTSVQMLTGRGGWPMSNFLTPDGKPFFGGTYFPPARFAELLRQVHEAWRNQRGQLMAQSERLTAAVSQATEARGEARKVGQAAILEAEKQMVERHDANLGGFGGAPKFPHEPELLFLLARSLRTGEPQPLQVATHSLDTMARGGIYDQVGGGFHRYSTDAEWLVPHFEKMLYNQAHLARAYLAAHHLTGNPFFARVARQTLDYFLREMTSPDGGFYSATDADSSGAEGEFFVWTPAELQQALAEDDAALAIDLWGVTDNGNFEGKNILFLEKSLADYAEETSQDLDRLLARVDRIRERLWQAREAREHPLRDDKVVTAWNGMMITAFAEGAEVLGDERYLAAATRAADFLWSRNRSENGDWWRIHLDGSSSIPALQEDHAYLAEALLTLYDVTGASHWLGRAREVADGMLEKFWDDEAGGFFMTAAGVDPHLIARPKSPNDGAIPSGNSVAVRSLAMLAARTGEATYGDRANATLSGFAESIERFEAGFGYMLMAADALLHGELGERQYAAAGTVKAIASVRPAKNGHQLEIELRIRDGWHVNAHQPLSDDLIPTVLSVGEDRGAWTLDEVRYPTLETVRLSFQDEPLAVYQGTVTLSGRLYKTGDPGLAPVAPVQLRIQACDDRVCLKPETLTLEVSTAGNGTRVP